MNTHQTFYWIFLQNHFFRFLYKRMDPKTLSVVCMSLSKLELTLINKYMCGKSSFSYYPCCITMQCLFWGVYYGLAIKYTLVTLRLPVSGDDFFYSTVLQFSCCHKKQVGTYKIRAKWLILKIDLIWCVTKRNWF